MCVGGPGLGPANLRASAVRHVSLGGRGLATLAQYGPAKTIRTCLDEPLARRNLTVLLRQDPDIGFVGECEWGRTQSRRFAERDSAGQVVFVNVVEIDWIGAADYYACLHVGNATHLLRRSLSDLEQDLDAGMFCRIHRSVIMNLRRIRGLELNDDGEFEVLLISNVRLRLSRRFRKTLQSRLGVA